MRTNRSDVQQRNGWMRPISLLLALVFALALGACGSSETQREDRGKTADARDVAASDAAASGVGLKGAAGAQKVYHAEPFEIDLEKTKVWPVCSELPDAFKAKYGLAKTPEVAEEFDKISPGLETCTFRSNKERYRSYIISVNLITVEQRKMLLKFLGDSPDPRLPDAALLRAGDVEGVNCEATIDTARGRVSAAGGDFKSRISQEQQCQEALDMLYDLISLTRGEFNA